MSFTHQRQGIVDFRVFKDLLAGRFRDDLQLLTSGRPVNVNRQQQGFAILIYRTPTSDFSRRSRFAGTLESDDHHGVGYLLSKDQSRRLASKEIDQLVVNDLDNLLRWLEFLPNLLALSLFLDRSYKVFSDFVVNI